MVSLRVTIGAMTALVVLVVAAATLSVTLVYSTEALVAIGKTHAGTMAKVAAARVGSTVDHPVAALGVMRLDARLNNRTLPSHTNGTITPFINSAVAAAVGNFPRLRRAQVFLADGSAVMVSSYGRKGHVQFEANNIDARGRATFTSDAFFPQNLTRTARIDCFGAVNASTLAAAAIARYAQAGNKDLAGRLAVWRPVDAEPIVRTMPDSTVRVSHALTSVAVLFGAHNAVLGAVRASIDSWCLRNLLAEGLTTPQSHATLIDDHGYVVVSTHAISVHPTTTHRFVANDHVPGLGCGTLHQPLVEARGPNVEVCRVPATHFGGRAMQYVARHTQLLRSCDSHDDVALHIRAGDHGSFFFARRTVRAAASVGGCFIVALIVPEEDVFIGVTRGRNVAIGISVAVFVLATAIAVVAVGALLHPLTVIAERMNRAANLSDASPQQERLSAMSEVRALQQSYAALNAQLHRLKSFVPQSVLRAGGGDSPDDANTGMPHARAADRYTASEAQGTAVDDDASSTSASTSKVACTADAHIVQPRTTRTDDDGHSTSSELSTRSASGGLSKALLAAAGVDSVLNTRIGVQERNVAIVMLNLRGFHAAVHSAAVVQLPRRYATFIDTVAKAAAETGGVLDSFHGDRVTLTYNAARACGHHTRRAAAAARLLAAKSSVFGVPVVASIAAGRALVGNLGAAAAKRFCTIGSVVARASTLLVRAAHYDKDVADARSGPSGAHVIASGQLLDDLAESYALLPVDYAFIAPRSRPVVIAEIVPLADSDGASTPSLHAATDTAPWLYAPNEDCAAAVCACETETDTSLSDATRLVYHHLREQDTVAARCALANLPADARDTWPMPLQRAAATLARCADSSKHGITTVDV